jgi:hypothetical protein
LYVGTTATTRTTEDRRAAKGKGTPGRAQLYIGNKLVGQKESVTLLCEQLAHLCLMLSCDKQRARAERERGTRLRVLVAK